MKSKFLTAELMQFFLDVANTESSKAQEAKVDHIDTPDFTGVPEEVFYLLVLEFIRDTVSEINEGGVEEFIPNVTSLVQTLSIMVNDYKKANPDWVGGVSIEKGMDGEIKNALS